MDRAGLKILQDRWKGGAPWERPRLLYRDRSPKKQHLENVCAKISLGVFAWLWFCRLHSPAGGETTGIVEKEKRDLDTRGRNLRLTAFVSADRIMNVASALFCRKFLMGPSPVLPLLHSAIVRAQLRDGRVDARCCCHPGKEPCEAELQLSSYAAESLYSRRGDALMNDLWSMLVDSFGKILLPGLTMTIPLTAISFSLAMVIAIAAALVQFAKVPVLKELCRFYIWVVRGTPLLVQLFVVFYGLPDLGIILDPFPSAVIVFSINEGAYCAETVRAALESVPRGQLEAAECAGLTWWQGIRRIVLPQAMRTAFPPLSNSLISMVKDTSLASNITVVEMFMATQRIASRELKFLPLYIEVALIYLLFCTVLTKLQRMGEKRLGAYN